ncbi:MAG: LEPR-XLL domain-containing protein, partial [Nitrospirota bacterium]|nr:LEPR-XLL domain-containing protein [Nitrospirota bacterium]
MERGKPFEAFTYPSNRKSRRFLQSWKPRKASAVDRSERANVYRMESLEPRVLLSAEPLLLLDGEELVSSLIEEPASEMQTSEQALAPAAAISLTTRSLDVDQDGEVTVEQDATLILRHLFGLRGQALVDGAVDTVNGLRQDATAITEFLTKSESTMLDPDANGTADVMSDGLTIFRYITLITEGGLTVDDMAKGVVDLVGGKRTDPNAIKAYLDGFLPGMDEIAPVITAGLLNDTGADPTDTLTFDPTIAGLIEDKNPIVRFEASIDGGGFHD